jgi:PAP2 superfamily
VPRPLAYLSRLLPRGISDAVLQFLLFFAVYQVYQLVRGLAEGRADLAFANAWHLVDIERATGTFFEPHLQDALLGTFLIDFANWMYINTHFVITTSFLVWLYLFRNEHFYFVRNMFMVAMGLALVGYTVFPTAPPRFLESAGFTDTIAAFTSVEQDSKAVSLLVNKYAAVPSMHIGFALMIAVPGFTLCRNPVARGFWSVYPLLVFFVIVLTANHFWLDAAAGAAVACVAAVTASQLARLRPGHWAFRPAEATGEATA